jgi:RHS repeat-associated protein
MSKTIGGTATQFLYDRLNPVQELNSSNRVVANLMTGLRTDEYFTRTASGTTSTFLGDALGSTIGLVTANNGPIATNYTYQPFGATTVGGSANGNSYEFTGRENDGTGLHFNRNRYYSPTLQRFIAQDPMDFGGGDTNLYSYAGNDPVDGADPLGLCTDPGGRGLRFCIEQYIPESSVWGFKGDNRGPMSNGGTYRDERLPGRREPSEANSSKQLVEAGQKVRALVRDLAKAAKFSNVVEVMRGDLSVPETPAAAFAGVNKAFVLSAGPELAKLEANAFDAAKQASIKHIAKLSGRHIDADFMAGTALMQWHDESERRLRTLGIGWTILRPGYFASNVLMQGSRSRARCFCRRAMERTRPSIRATLPLGGEGAHDAWARGADL